jgi:pSer/pThr/pTyr-binding forkhead associated (FHA) protein
MIGRGSHSDISVTDDALSVNHARISFHHAQWWLEDIGSTNGTFLNKDQISVPTVIISGDNFKCGNTSFAVRIESSSDNYPSNIQNETGGPK